MKAIRYQVKLEEPLLATQPISGEPNSAVSLNYIPGSMLRGAFIGRYLNGKTKKLTEDEKFHRMFFSGEVLFLNAYLQHSEQRMLPKPLSWFVEKSHYGDENADLFDFAIEKAEMDESAKNAWGEFIWKGSESFLISIPEMKINVHNASENPVRKMEGESQVFRYEALAAGQTFEGAILFPNDDTWYEEILSLLSGKYSLGGAGRAGYGRVQLTVYDEDLDDWQEYRQGKDQEKIATLTCLSDVILPATELSVADYMTELVGESPQESYFRMHLVGGFNRTWGLPLPQQWAIQAGSVFVFSNQAKDKLEQLVVEGIGDRRVEGFGRIAANLTTDPSLEWGKTSNFKIENQDIQLASDSESYKLCKKLAEVQLRTALDTYVSDEVVRLTNGPAPFKGLPSPSQLSRARMAAKQASQMADFSPLQGFFNELKELSARTWKGAKIGHKDLQKWILEDIDAIQKFSPVSLPEVAGVKADLTTEMKITTKARVIEGVLKQAAKMERDS